MRPAVAALVLDGLEGETARVHVVVPARERPHRAAAPAPERLDVLGEVEEVRADARDPRQRRERRAARVGSSPSFAASASANSAGSFLGARPSSDTATMRATTRAPSAAMQRRTASAFSRVSLRSDA